MNAKPDRLPHAFPFRCFDRIIEYVPGTSATTEKVLTSNETLCRDPEIYDVTPFLIEACAQTSGLIVKTDLPPSHTPTPRETHGLHQPVGRLPRQGVALCEDRSESAGSGTSQPLKHVRNPGRAEARPSRDDANDAGNTLGFLSYIDHFELEQQPQCGDRITICSELEKQFGKLFKFVCTIKRGGADIGRGSLALAIG